MAKLEETWRLEDHLCSACFGRLLSRKPEGAPRIYRCGTCGAESTATSRQGGKLHPAICACSTRYGSQDGGLRCVVNAERGPLLPYEIVVKEER